MAVIGCIATTVTVHFMEELNWVDSVDCSVTPVRYGDYACLHYNNIIWLLISTLAVARAFLFVELRNILLQWIQFI